ncbi:type III polyketide synthase [Kutzneria kofuensis]|uniref:Putative naringenin-chalcone synthase n=1 Tax=Kutzneria kofuensis TaxID=103725 RepID=A0A7W9KBP4_9PSEU|nr:3-oxoacyl-[acyl-carrier-protein] synthase III C-terminal domain-containing protein [Kutzneria kofuensis]MBB5889495.1 putative naringenin-chalcone synthase [Kutzneria kofuensis]
MTAVTIAGMGRALPAAVSQQELWDGYFRQHVDSPGFGARIFANSGVVRRHAVLNPLVEDVSGWSTGQRMRRYAVEAVPLGSAAVSDALDQAGIAASEVGLFAVASCTGYVSPGVDVHVAAELGMPAELRRLVFGHMGCYAAIPALGAVADYVAAHARPAVLLNVELTSLHVQPAGISRDQIVAHALFSDAAVATVLAPGAGLEVVDLVALTDPGTPDHMTWDVTDLGFRMGLSPKVPDVLALHLRPAVEGLLRRNGVTEVAGWAVHPGGPRILETVEEELKLPADALDASRAVLAEHGNCSSATVLLVLQRLLPVRGHVVLLAFGPGLTLYALLLRHQ